MGDLAAQAFLPGGDPRDVWIMEISSQTILNWIIQYGYIGLFCLLMLGIVGVPFPDELTMTCAGYLIFKGYLQPGPTIIAAFLGSVCGISLSYTIGRVVGTSLIDRYGNRFHVTPQKLKSINQWFERFGKWTLVFGYFLTGFRHLVAIVAGTVELRLPAFALFAYTGALIWSVTFISLGYFLGEQWTRIAGHAETVALILTALVCAAGPIYLLRRRRIQQPPGNGSNFAP
jgi:membrane protein DedA with SNARE-associated domain